MIQLIKQYKITIINNIEYKMLYYLLPDCNHILKSVDIKFKFKCNKPSIWDQIYSFYFWQKYNLKLWLKGKNI